MERANAWAREHGLVDRFVVMHSGNLGYAQDLQTVLHAATYLRDLEDLDFVLIGSGAMGTELAALAKRLGLRNVRFLPYQPRERLAESLSSADVHVVGLAAGLAGYVVPSRLYGILAVGVPSSSMRTRRARRPRSCGRTGAASSSRRAIPSASHRRSATRATVGSISSRWGRLRVRTRRRKQVETSRSTAIAR